MSAPEEGRTFAEMVGDCVHCGFCLPTCPTYVLWGEEMDSPRGRIHLMAQGLEGEPLDDATVAHFDRCLGCMACVTACPSGVRYDRLIETTRARVEQVHHRTWRERAVRGLLFGLFPHPRRLRALRGPLRAYQRSGLSRLVRASGVLDRLPAEVAVMESLLPDLPVVEPVPELTPAQGTRRGTVGLLLGCVQRTFFPGVNAATVRVLSAEGFDVVAPKGQGCCGALSLHVGRADEAGRFARRVVDTFGRAGVEHVVVNSAGCGSAMKDYADLLRHDPGYAGPAARLAARVRDVAEFLAQAGTTAPRHPLPLAVAYHDACHLAHAQRVRSEPRALLGEVPGLVVREVAEGELCCGSAGVYNVLQPDAARALGERKAAHVAATGADLLVAANPGCLLQVDTALRRRGGPLPTAHTVEVLDASIRGAGVDALLR